MGPPGREDLGCPVPAAPAWDPTSTWFFPNSLWASRTDPVKKVAASRKLLAPVLAGQRATKDADGT